MPTYPGLHIYLASAGSGKTQTLAKAVVDSAHARPDKGILAITFTVKAAGELRQRILQVAKQKDPALLRQFILGQLQLETSTIDSLIRRLYLHLAPFLMLPTEERLIVEEADWLRFEKEILTQLWQALSSRRALRQELLERLQNNTHEQSANYKKVFRELLEDVVTQGPLRTLIDKVLAKPGPLEDPFLSRAQKDYGKATKSLITPALLELVEELTVAYRQEHHSLFLSDLQYIMELAAQNLPLHVAYPYREYGHILVDEAQDTSPTQWRILDPLLREILQAQGQVTLVGDPKQSIYAWRGADPTSLLEWARQGFVHPLSLNYRSHRRIVAFNNGLYAKLQALLWQRLPPKNQSKADAQRYARQHAALSYIEKVYKNHQQKKQKQPRQASSATRHPQVSRFSRRPLIRVRGYATDRAIAEHLRRALHWLACRGIPPNETAFLVRHNEDISWLSRLLPGYNLQLTIKKLGEVPSIRALFRFLSAGQEEAPARLYLGSLGKPLVPWLESLHQAKTPLEFWERFRLLAQAILQVWPSEKLFWETLLDRLWTFWYEMGIPSVAQTLAWWEAYGQEVSVEIPILPDTYPVLTIHKAKGLAWEAVILPRVDWKLFHYSSRGRKWYPAQKVSKYLPAYLHDFLGIKPGVACALELPFKLQSSEKELAPLYELDYQAAVLENLNLHYVATTRPRKVLLVYYPFPQKVKEGLPQCWNEAWNLIQKAYV